MLICYTKRMRLLKKIARGLCAYGFRVSLFGLALASAFVVTFGSPEPLKTALSNSGLYDAPLTDLVDLQKRTGDNEQAQTISEQSNLSIDDPIVQGAINDALPAEKKQQIVEDTLNGSYVWQPL